MTRRRHRSQLRGDRVTAVGDDLQVEMVERHRLRGVHLDPLPLRLAERGAPRSGRVAVEGRRAACHHVTGQVLRGEHGDATRRRVGEPERGVEHVVGRGGGEADRAPGAERAVARDPQLADQRLLVLGGPRRDDDRARSAHLEDERVVGGERPRGGDEVGGHAHDLVGVHVGRARRVVADPDLGEADVVAQRVVECCRRRWCRRARSRAGGTSASGT